MNGMRRHDAEVVDTAGTKKKPSVAIVILNWNGRGFLQQFLPSVVASVYENKRVIIVDNASTDDSVSFLKQQYPQVEIIQHSNNEGFAKGYNAALTQVESDYYVLLNSDVEVTPDWICPVIELMETDPLIAICQPKILAYHNKTQFEYAGASGGWMDSLGYPFMRGRIFDTLEDDLHQYDTAQQCFWASGAAFFVKAKQYHQLGGLDEYFFAHQEEIDFCWRLQLAGYKVYVQPASIVYHVGGGTLPMGNSKKTFLNFRNNLIALTKNSRAITAAWKIPFRILLDWVAALQGLMRGDSGYSTAIMKAHFHYINWFLFNKKKSVFPITKKGKPSGCYNGSIVWDYFIKKKKTFSEIIGNK